MIFQHLVSLLHRQDDNRDMIYAVLLPSRGALHDTDCTTSTCEFLAGTTPPHPATAHQHPLKAARHWSAYGIRSFRACSLSHIRAAIPRCCDIVPSRGGGTSPNCNFSSSEHSINNLLEMKISLRLFRLLDIDRSPARRIGSGWHPLTEPIHLPTPFESFIDAAANFAASPFRIVRPHSSVHCVAPCNYLCRRPPESALVVCKQLLIAASPSHPINFHRRTSICLSSNTNSNRSLGLVPLSHRVYRRGVAVIRFPF